MGHLRKVVKWLDHCVLGDDHVCQRCGVDWEGPFEPGTFGACRAGREIQVGWAFWCPGCEAMHVYSVHPEGHPRGVVWSFNGDEEKPSFTPSLLVFETEHNPRCHLFLTDGVIHFCGDCGHPLAGKVAPLGDEPP